MGKNRITILLIKEGTPSENIIKNAQAMALANGNTLYYKENSLRVPKWVDGFFVGSNADKEKLKSKSVSAVILYKVTVEENVERVFAICFGFGRNLINQDVIERRFGLLVALNILENNALRSVDTTTLDAVPLNMRTQASALSGIANFNIDANRELVKTITGRSENANFSGTLTGADSLSVPTPNTYDDMDELLKIFYSLFVSEEYKSKYEWIDQMFEVKDSALIGKLNDKVLEQLNSDNPTNIWVSFPEIIDYETINTFKLKSGTLYSDIDINTVKSEFGEVLDIQNVKSSQIKGLSADESTIKHWSLYRCIYADIGDGEKQYCLNDGKWFEVDQNFARKVTNFYNETERIELQMPDFSYKDEKDYNSNTAHEVEAFFLMDRDNISYGGQQIEFCDIYTNDKQFIHVKRYSSSSTLSHLFSQGLVSAECFMDKAFRSKVNEKLSEDFMIPNVENIIPSDYTVVYAIAKKNTVTGSLPEIPFFSKVTYHAAASRLRRFGYKVGLYGINYTYNGNNQQGEPN